MTQTLADFITGRLRDLTAQQAPLRAQLEEIEKEIEQLLRAAEAAGITTVDRLAGSQTATAVPQFTRRSVPEKTIKEAVLTVLDQDQGSLSANQILGRINAYLGVNYPRTSLSPQLSRLKTDGLIERDPDGWRLAATKSESKNSRLQTDLEDALK